MDSSYDQVLHLAMTDRSRKRRQTTALFLLSFYDGAGVSLYSLRDSPEDQRGWFVAVMQEYVSDPKGWTRRHRHSVRELQKAFSAR